MAEPESPDTPLLRAILALLVEQHEARGEGRRTEILLADAGLGARDIAAITGKQPAAVRMALSRARRATRGKADA